MKGRIFANESTQKSCIPRKKASNPTVNNESMPITRVIDTEQENEVVTMDILNAFFRLKCRKVMKESS